MQPIQADRQELIFALVGAAGTRLDKLAEALKIHLRSFGYNAVDIRLSDLLVNFKGWKPQTGALEVERITHLQDMGNAFRNSLDDGAALARASIAEIRRRRAEVSGDPDIAASGYAYILSQLKHPSEVDLLRRVYGASFFLIGGHSPHDKRRKDLAALMARKAAQPDKSDLFLGSASELIARDEKQDDDLGQNMRDTYPKADFFANLAIDLGELQISRFVDLVFGHPFRTPSPDEYAMYQASAVALRSSDNNRQVGCAVVHLTEKGGRKEHADIIAVGMNEVPRAGGGFYWDEDSPDNRDQALLLRNEDRANEIKISALAELIEKLRSQGWFNAQVGKESAIDLAQALLPSIKGTQFMNLSEFSRPVHAEMAALIDAARRGVAVDGLTMFVTTYPCHNCAKHIIAAGIRKLVYLQPYPKSRAILLHGEEIEMESLDGRAKEGQVVFCAFTGVAPRQYRQLFSMSERGMSSVNEWYREKLRLSPLYVPRNASFTYKVAERQELEVLPSEICSSKVS
jgi:deoxycytidylate deaminase